MTETSNLEGLLKQWAELEPATCIVQDSGDFMIAWKDGLDIRLHHGRLSDEWDAALLQAAVQEAIEARGWSWSVWHNFSDGTSGESHYSAFVDIINGEDAMPGDLEHSSTADEALLSAYIAAIESKAP